MREISEKFYSGPEAILVHTADGQIAHRSPAKAEGGKTVSRGLKSNTMLVGTDAEIDEIIADLGLTPIVAVEPTDEQKVAALLAARDRIDAELAKPELAAVIERAQHIGKAVVAGPS